MPFQALRETLVRIPLFEAFLENTDTVPSPLFVDRDYDMFEQIYLLISSVDTDVSKLPPELVEGFFVGV